MYTIVPVIQQNLKSSAVKITLVKREIQNVSDYLEQQDIISKYHTGKTNHRGINETYLSLSQRYFCPKLKEQITGLYCPQYSKSSHKVQHSPRFPIISNN